LMPLAKCPDERRTVDRWDRHELPDSLDAD